MPWQILLMVTGGQIGLPLAIALSLFGGCLIAVVELIVRVRPPVSPGPARQAGRRSRRARARWEARPRAPCLDTSSSTENL